MHYFVQVKYHCAANVFYLWLEFQQCSSLSHSLQRFPDQKRAANHESKHEMLCEFMVWIQTSNKCLSAEVSIPTVASEPGAVMWLYEENSIHSSIYERMCWSVRESPALADKNTCDSRFPRGNSVERMFIVLWYSSAQIEYFSASLVALIISCVVWRWNRSRVRAVVDIRRHCCYYLETRCWLFGFNVHTVMFIIIAAPIKEPENLICFHKWVQFNLNSTCLRILRYKRIPAHINNTIFVCVLLLKLQISEVNQNVCS